MKNVTRAPVRPRVRKRRRERHAQRHKRNAKQVSRQAGSRAMTSLGRNEGTKHIAKKQIIQKQRTTHGVGRFMICFTLSSFLRAWVATTLSSILLDALLVSLVDDESV